MKSRKEFAGALLLAAVMAVSPITCEADGISSLGVASDRERLVTRDSDENASRTYKTYKSNGMKLSIPRTYGNLLVVDTPGTGKALFAVSEKASIDADKSQGGSGDGAGWLFSIGTISESQLHDMLQRDMSGTEVFARDDNGIYYAYYHPTDVRLVRKDYGNPDDMKVWTMLNAWARDTVRKRFIADNAALTAETYGNSGLDIYLARAAFAENTEYTISASGGAPLHPTIVSPVPYAMRLLRNAQTEALDSSVAPEGECIVLNFPKDNVRFDFFLADGSENVYRQTWNGNEQLFRITFADGKTRAAAVVKKWYDALAGAKDMRALGYTPDDLIGRWAEKMAGRGLITITAKAKGVYDARIEWADGAARQHIWEMTAHPTGEGGALYYENGKHIIRTYKNKHTFSDETMYKNGTGKFYLNSAYELMWEDDTDGSGDNAVFVSTTASGGA